MFGLQPIHWLVIILIGILLFAPSKLPELIRALSKSVREFRASVKEQDTEHPSDSSKTQKPGEIQRRDTTKEW